MTTKAHLLLMADYNQWMNTKVYTACASLSDEQRKEDRGAFFRSIHGTLNHILLADRVWLGRLNGEPFAITGLDQELYGDFRQLRSERQQTDQTLLEYIKRCPETSLAQVFHYRNIAGAEKQLPLYVVLTHLFNHQTHHRGQLTTLLNQLGLDVGATDIIAMPFPG